MAVSFVYEVCVEFTVVKRGNITFGDEDIIVLISKVEEFKKNNNWIEYTERLEYYFTANEITDNEMKRAVLLSSCGAKTYKLPCNHEFSGPKEADQQIRC